MGGLGHVKLEAIVRCERHAGGGLICVSPACPLGCGVLRHRHGDGVGLCDVGAGAAGIARCSTEADCDGYVLRLGGVVYRLELHIERNQRASPWDYECSSRELLRVLGHRKTARNRVAEIGKLNGDVSSTVPKLVRVPVT